MTLVHCANGMCRHRGDDGVCRSAEIELWDGHVRNSGCDHGHAYKGCSDCGHWDKGASDEPCNRCIRLSEYVPRGEGE